MRTQINYLFSISFVLLCCFSCSQEDTSTMEEPQVVKLQLEFETSTENELEGASFETHHLEIISTSPLIIESETLKVIEIAHPVTEEIVELIVPKINHSENSEDPCESEFGEVWNFDLETLCFVFWGYYSITPPECMVKFFPTINPHPPAVCLTDLVHALP